MKVFCKQSYIIHSDGTELYTKGLWYEVFDKDPFGEGYSIINNFPNFFDEYYFPTNKNTFSKYGARFEDFFY